jgi:hypothetical protein
MKHPKIFFTTFIIVFAFVFTATEAVAQDTYTVELDGRKINNYAIYGFRDNLIVCQLVPNKEGAVIITPTFTNKASDSVVLTYAGILSRDITSQLTDKSDNVIIIEGDEKLKPVVITNDRQNQISINKPGLLHWRIVNMFSRNAVVCVNSSAYIGKSIKSIKYHMRRPTLFFGHFAENTNKLFSVILYQTDSLDHLSLKKMLPHPVTFTVQTKKTQWVEIDLSKFEIEIEDYEYLIMGLETVDGSGGIITNYSNKDPAIRQLWWNTYSITLADSKHSVPMVELIVD